MPAGVFAPGVIDVFYRPRPQVTSAGGWRYLGTSVTSPDIESLKIYMPITCDLNSPAPFQEAFCSEQHRVIITLNRLNFRNYNKLRNELTEEVDIRREFKTGRLVIAADDFQLFIRYALPTIAVLSPLAVAFRPDGVARGRLYHSAIVVNCNESAVNGRVQEATILFECNPLYYKSDKKFKLFTEHEADLPSVEPE